VPDLRRNHCLAVSLVLASLCVASDTAAAALPLATVLEETGTKDERGGVRLGRLVLPTLVSMLLVLPASSDGEERFSDQDYDVALDFFRGGGAWAFRLLPSSEPDKETTWSVLLLCSKGSDITSFTLGATQLGPKSSIASARKILDLYSADRSTMVEFLRRYAELIDTGEVEARLLAVAPLDGGASLPVKAAVILAGKGLLDLTR